MRNRHQPNCPMGQGGDCCTCDFGQPAIRDMRADRVKAATDYLVRRISEDPPSILQRDQQAIKLLLFEFGYALEYAEGAPKRIAETVLAMLYSKGGYMSPSAMLPLIEEALRKELGNQQLPELPCCPVHENLLRAGKLRPLDNCVVCTRNHRDNVLSELANAEALLKRGVKALNRVGWEKGATDDEWRKAAESFLTARQMERDYEKTQEKS